jgi:hypothetical protein
MGSKFGGIPKRQKKPAVCHKSKLQNRKPPIPIDHYTAIIHIAGSTIFGDLINEGIIITLNQSAPGSAIYQGTYREEELTAFAEILNPKQEFGVTKVAAQAHLEAALNVIAGELESAPEKDYPFHWGPHELEIILGKGKIELQILS